MLADTSSGMDDAFSLVAARMPRSRRLSPFDVRLIALAVVAALLIVAFAAFVVAEQHVADVRRAATVEAQHAAEAARADAAAVAMPSVDGSAVIDGLDTQAQESATAALHAATAMTDGLDAATPAALSALEPDLVFVDGPSATPSVVSVYVGTAGWAAAVHSGADTCYWVARTAGGHDRFGTGAACTGLAALAADQPSW
jgi:hypothetical protein